MQVAETQVSIFLKVAAVLASCMFLMVLVQAMNREGFEERFGYDSERVPEFGMSDSEIEQRRFQTAMTIYGGGGHHHH